jgi:hypothetical protein
LTFQNPACGQAVADCVADAYNNHGWVSIWAQIQTLWIPQTLGAISAACAYTIVFVERVKFAAYEKISFIMLTLANSIDRFSMA